MCMVYTGDMLSCIGNGLEYCDITSILFSMFYRLRAIAHSCTENEYDENVRKMTSLDIWASNENLVTYVTKTWLKEAHVS